MTRPDGGRDASPAPSTSSREPRGASRQPPGASRQPPVVGLLCDLVRIPSENPSGDMRPIAAFLERWLAETGATVLRVVPPEKPEAESVVATIGDGQGPVIMLHAHIDTVPVGETEAQRWQTDPFEPDVRDGRVYGKGAVDDKAALAAMMIAFRRFAAMPERKGTLVLVAASEEEVGGQLGTRHLVDAGHLPEADFVVVGEQTDNRAASAHKGVTRATVTIRGESCHATNPDRGVSAIYAMSRVLVACERYHEELRSRRHPLVGSPTCNVGTIVGGSTTNAVPDVCTITLDRRMIPREDPDAVQDEIRAVVAAADIAPATAEVGGFLVSSWFDADLEGPYGQAFLQAIERSKGSAVGPIGYLPGSDAKHLMGVARGGMAVFGPGSYEVAHAANEYVEIAALEESEAILVDFLGQVMQG